MTKRGFTLVEIVIVLSLIAILSAILIPTFIDIYNKEKSNIIDIHNGTTKEIYIDDNGNIIEDTTNYELYDVNVIDGVIIYKYKLKEK